MFKKFWKNDEGATAIVFALGLPVFIGGIVFAVELGHWNQKKSKLQDMTDASAVAAAQEIMVLADKANYDFAGKGHAFENGFNFNAGNVTITYPPTTGKFAGREAVDVVFKNKQPTYFTKYFGMKSVDVETKATAVILPGHPACVLSLSPDMNPAISSGGSSDVNLNGCSIHTNSNGPKSIDVDNLHAECISAVGGITTSAATTSTCDKNLDYSFAVRDPYADIEIGPDYDPTECLTPERISRTSVRMHPGRYCSTVSKSGLIEFMPGTHYFDNAWLKTTGQSALIYGRGVTIVFMNDGGLANATGSEIDLVAPTSGPFAGIAIYYDRDTMTPDGWLDVAGNQQSSIEGVIYAPTTNIKVLGAANSTSQCTQIVANSVHFNGNAEFTNQDCEAAGVRKIGGESGVTLVQ